MRSPIDVGALAHGRVKLLRQTEISECGLAALAMVANFYGYKVDLGTMRRRFAPSLRGASLKTLITVADQINLNPRAVKLQLEDLDKLHLPAIAHWNLNHYVVIEKFERGKVLIHDPASNSKWMPIEQVSRHFTGVALELRPSVDFELKDERRRLRLSQLWRNLSGFKRALVQTLMLSIVLQAYVLIFPYFMQLSIDRVLPAQDRDLLVVLALGFGLFMALNVGATLLRSYVLLWAGTQMGYGLASNLARRLFRLPISWFEKRHVGDILSRFQSITPIQNLLLTGAIAALIDGSMALLTIAVMFYYSSFLAAVALLAFLLYLAIRIISFPFEKDAIEETITTGAAEQSTLIETIRGITALRLANRETLRHAFWQSKLTDNFNADVRLARIGIWQQAANGLVSGAENIISIYFAVTFVLNGGFSVGMIFAYMAYKNQFMQKATSLASQFIAFRMIGLHLDRLSDIALSEEDVSFGSSSQAETELKGKIELKEIQFRYSPSDPFVLDGVNLTIQPGDHVAITGPSGGGKSTLVKIILGLVEPDEGELLVDGQPISRFGHKSYHEQIAAVLQDDTLFAGSLSDNIALFDESPDKNLILASAQIAAIHNDIMDMPMQYDTLVGDMGSSLSGGQRQRVLLARALYRRPKILVMDEGTAHLDIAHERAINSAIQSMGITRIVIAHRKESVDSARAVFIMQDGKIFLRDEVHSEPG